MKKPEHVYQTGPEAYAQLTEYLSPAQKEVLDHQLNALNGQEADLAAIAMDIGQGQWVKLFTSEQRSHFPAQALCCLRDGKITTMQYVSSQMFYNVFTAPENQDKSPKIERVINSEGKVIRSSMHKIEATMKLASSSFKEYTTRAVQQAETKEEQSRFFRSMIKAPVSEEDILNRLLAGVDLTQFDAAEKAGHMDWVSEAEKNAFYQKIKKLPVSEQHFMIIDDPLFNGYSVVNKTSVMQQINYRLGFNIFSRLRIDGKPKLMIPSAGMIQAYLEATRANTRMPAVYRFGLSPLEGLYKTMKSGCRDKIICTPLLPELTPSHADLQPANSAWAESEMHDFYHETLCANVPFGDRKLFVEFIDKLQSIGHSLSGVKTYVDAVREFLIDMEHRAYDRHIGKTLFLKIFASMKSTDPHARFWSVIDLDDKYCSLKLLSKEKQSDPRRLEAIEKTFDGARRKVAPAIASWLLTKDQTFFEQFKLDFTQLMAFPSDPNSLIGLIQLELKQSLERKIKDRRLPELLEMLFPTKESGLKTLGFSHSAWVRSIMPTPERPGPLLTDAIKRAIVEIIEQDFVSAILVTYELKSTFLMKLVHKDLGDNMMKYIKSGMMRVLEAEYPRQYNYILSYFRATSEADNLVKVALRERDPCSDEILDRLYPSGDVNLVFATDNTTLLQRALRAENLDLMFRLTNEGASVVEVLGASKPCPLVESNQYGRYELMVLMIYAFQYGAGWMQKFPDVVDRIRRMAAPYQSRSNYDYPRQEEDDRWAIALVERTSIPRHLFNSVDLEKLTRETQSTVDNVHRFLNTLKTNDHITPDMNDPTVEAFLRAKQWADRGGPMPNSPMGSDTL